MQQQDDLRSIDTDTSDDDFVNMDIDVRSRI